MRNRTIISESFQQTKNLGRDIAKELKKEQVIALYGDLGSGKTTFVQGLAVGLGIKRRIISPTFIIVRSYSLESQKSKVKSQNYNSKFKNLEPRKFYHIDLYRIEGEGDIENLGIKEVAKDPENIVAIEWAEKMGDFLPKKRIDIRFFYIDNDKRRIDICPKVE